MLLFLSSVTEDDGREAAGILQEDKEYIRLKDRYTDGGVPLVLGSFCVMYDTGISFLLIR